MTNNTPVYTATLATIFFAIASAALADQHDDQGHHAVLDAQEDAAHSEQFEAELADGAWHMEADEMGDKLALKVAALEALMNAPPKRAMPLIKNILEGEQDERLKRRALFVLSQMDHKDAAGMLLQVARTGSPALRKDAIRSIGIGGDAASLSGLMDVYRQGDRSIKKAVLHAFLIADEEQRVFELARTTQVDKEFEDAVRVLASMGATDKLRELKNRAPAAEGLIQAFAVAGDIESLTEIAASDAQPEIRQRAIRAIGVTGGDRAGEILAGMYRDSRDEMVRHAALEGLMVADDDERILALFRASTNDREKRMMLRMLVSMDSDAALDIIDSTLRGND
ncbi:MAG: HEAT repeat domain-containing protein [Gammaproteobacteria bacterium]